MLRSPPLCLGDILWFRQNCLPLRVSDPVQNSVHGFLDAGVWPVELPRRLGGKLTEHITIPQEYVKHQKHDQSACVILLLAL